MRRTTGFIIYVLSIILLGLMVTGFQQEVRAARVLQRGMYGSDVKKLQTNLREWGYTLRVDGHFGPQTVNVVKAFQADHGLEADGIVGEKTWAAIAAAPFMHIVHRGDSLYLLAKRYHTSVEAIMDANDLTDEIIMIGQKLVIPRQQVSAGGGAEDGTPQAVVYRVKPGESAYAIAKKFNTTVPALAAANRLSDPSLLRIGQKLIIPRLSARGGVPSFTWPVRGRITSRYGWRTHPVYKNRHFHGGIDIAVPQGTVVRAAASGVVIRSSYMGGFGYGVVIDHGEGITTWYGHNSRLLVERGERVRKGQAIALSGSTGVSTGPHLDFRIKINGETVNPEYWLP